MGGITMDEFLNDIYINVYKKWILSHNQDDCKLYLVDDGEIKMETKYGIGQICFKYHRIFSKKYYY